MRGHKKLFRLYREEGLTVRRRRSRKRALGTRRPILVPDRANQRWSLDFVSDAFLTGSVVGSAHLDYLIYFAPFTQLHVSRLTSFQLFFAQSVCGCCRAARYLMP